jgi:hypothetical protein
VDHNFREFTKDALDGYTSTVTCTPPDPFFNKTGTYLRVGKLRQQISIDKHAAYARICVNETKDILSNETRTWPSAVCKMENIFTPDSMSPNGRQYLTEPLESLVKGDKARPGVHYPGQQVYHRIPTYGLICGLLTRNPKDELYVDSKNVSYQYSTVRYSRTLHIFQLYDPYLNSTMNLDHVAWIYDDQSKPVQLQKIHRQLLQRYNESKAPETPDQIEELIESLADSEWPMKMFLRGIFERKDLFYIKKDATKGRDVLYVRIIKFTDTHIHKFFFSIFPLMIWIKLEFSTRIIIPMWISAINMTAIAPFPFWSL